MKKLLLTILVILTLLPSKAQFFDHNEIKYRITSVDNQTCEVYSSTSKPLDIIIIPDNVEYEDLTYKVTAIAERAFQNNTMTEVEIGNSVTEIGSYAFINCTGLTSVKIGDSVTTIKSNAFQGCSQLSKVIISNLEAWCKIDYDITQYTNNANPLLSAGHLYLDDTEITNLIIPEGIEEIKPYAFAGFKAMKSVKIPNSVTSIGAYAFFTCTGLTSVEIPNPVKSIGIAAFQYCDNLETIKIPDSLTTIGVSAFGGGVVKELNVVISNLEAWCKIDNAGFSSAWHLYLNESEITDLVIPKSIEEIKPNAFRDCTSLTSVEIPNSVKSIGYNAFYNCPSLTSVEIPNSVKSIEDSAFFGCPSLTNVEIPNSVTSIGGLAFFNCTGLTSISLGKSLTKIGDFAFNNCEGLTSITSLNVTPPIFGETPFYQIPTSTCVLYVPMQSVEAYKEADYWKDFTNIQGIEIVNGNIQAQDFDIQKKGTQNLNLNFSFSSSQNYSGFQFDVEMPEGLKITGVKLSDELTAAGFELDNTSIEGNPVRVISYKTTGNGVSTTEGIVTLTIKADADASEGEKTIKFTNARLSSTGGTSIPLDDSSVTVTVKAIPVSTINVAYESGKQGDLYVDDTAVYKATVTPADATYSSVTWSIADPTVAQITTGDDNSKVTVKALKIGETTLKATANDGSQVVGSATIKVVATPISSVSISSQDNKTSIYPEETLTLTATVNPAKATTPITYKWTSDNTAVATVTDNASQITLTALKTGTANITVTATNAAGAQTSQKFTITVAPRPITSVTVDKEGPISLYVGGTETLKATVNPSNATDPVIEWSSSKPEVAKVENGTITALSLGTTQISVKATNSAGSQSTTITVNVVATPAESVTISGEKHYLKVTEEIILTATISPEETTYKEILWTSSDDTKATVDSNGKVTAKAVGQVTITATVKETPSKSDTYDITITDLIMGDANDDGVVDVADVVTIVNEYLHLPNDNEALLLSYDFNNSGDADEYDWKQTVDIILGQVGTRTRAYSTGGYTELASVDNIIVKENQGFGAFSKNIELDLSNSFDYVAMSIEVLIPEGSTVESVSKGNKLNNHSIAYNVVEGNRLKIAVYSTKNNILGNDRNLLNIELSNISEIEHVKIDKAYATDSGSQRYSLGSDNDYAGIKGIAPASDGIYHVFTIQGINVMNTEKAEDLEKLENGIYIINGLKVMIMK
ncbi:MAG: leucine-rich repeat protein [Muribaculaceae bacterium]|nr:leucine-rich repeat protein [Muribaculaceae bacterium]